MIQVTLYDDNEDEADHPPQTEVLHSHDGVLDWTPEGSERPITFKVIDAKMDTPTSALEGFEFVYENDTWGTADKAQCSEGKEVVS